MYLILKYVPLTSRQVVSSTSLYLGSWVILNDKSEKEYLHYYQVTCTLNVTLRPNLEYNPLSHIVVRLIINSYHFCSELVQIPSKLYGVSAWVNYHYELLS